MENIVIADDLMGTLLEEELQEVEMFSHMLHDLDLEVAFAHDGPCVEARFKYRGSPCVGGVRGMDFGAACGAVHWYVVGFAARNDFTIDRSAIHGGPV